MTASIPALGGMSNTNLILDDAVHNRDGLLQPDVMGAPVVRLASEASNGVNGVRFIGYYWNESLPLRERIE